MNFVNLSVRVLFILIVTILGIFLANKTGIHFNNFYLRLVMIVGIVLSTKYSPISALVLSIIFISNQISYSKDDTDNPNN